MLVHPKRKILQTIAKTIFFIGFSQKQMRHYPLFIECNNICQLDIDRC